jgi:hypothetical protein
MKAAGRAKRVWLATLGVTLVALSLSSCGNQKQEEKKAEPVRKDLLAANHSSWLFIGRDSDNQYYYYNQELVQLTDLDTALLWIKRIDASRGEGEALGRPHVLLRLEVSCPKEEYRILQYIGVDVSGSRKALEAESAEWNTVIPDTLGYAWYTSACSTPEVILDKAWKAARGVSEVMRREGKKE